MGDKNRGPVKTTINLAQADHKLSRPVLAVPIVAVLAAVLCVFVKFGIIDQLSAVSRIEEQAGREEILISQIQIKTAGYQEILEKYQIEVQSRPDFYGAADAMKCLELMENVLLNSAKVSSFTVSGSTITVKISGVTLNNISSIYQNLMASDVVSGVQVYTAAADSGGNRSVIATMTIKLEEKETAETGTKEEETP
ncbi:hypothetical protein AALB39_15080 [Lachnospiraceae bacterium 54-53]